MNGRRAALLRNGDGHQQSAGRPLRLPHPAAPRSPPDRGRAAPPRRSASRVRPRSTGSLRSRLVEFSHRKIPLHAPFSGGAISMTGNETGPDIRRSVSSRARVHRPGLTVVVLAATVLPPTVYLVAPGADPGRIGLGIAGAERPQVAGEGTLGGHTAAGDVRPREGGGGGRPAGWCDRSYCPALG